MIVGFTKEDERMRRDQTARQEWSSCTAAIHRWGVEAAGKAIASTPLAQYSLLGHYRIIQNKKAAAASEWGRMG